MRQLSRVSPLPLQGFQIVARKSGGFAARNKIPTDPSHADRYSDAVVAISLCWTGGEAVDPVP